jgi:hypothetical protein
MVHLQVADREGGLKIQMRIVNILNKQEQKDHKRGHPPTSGPSGKANNSSSYKVSTLQNFFTQVIFSSESFVFPSPL